MGMIYLYLEPKSGIIRLSKTTQNGAMLQAFAVVSQVFKGDRAMSDFNPDCVLIPLSKTGKYAGQYTAIVDAIDADLALQDWFTTHTKTTNPYAARRVRDSDNKRVLIAMHRVIMEGKLNRSLENHEYIDHINGNGLDNRRENLRLATQAQNQANQRIQQRVSHGYKGVHWHKASKKWNARIQVNGKRISLGYYHTPEEAHEAYCNGARKYFGEFANCGNEVA